MSEYFGRGNGSLDGEGRKNDLTAEINASIARLAPGFIASHLHKQDVGDGLPGYQCTLVDESRGVAISLALSNEDFKDLSTLPFADLTDPITTAVDGTALTLQKTIIGHFPNTLPYQTKIRLVIANGEIFYDTYENSQGLLHGRTLFTDGIKRLGGLISNTNFELEILKSTSNILFEINRMLNDALLSWDDLSSISDEHASILSEYGLLDILKLKLGKDLGGIIDWSKMQTMCIKFVGTDGWDNEYLLLTRIPVNGEYKIGAYRISPSLTNVLVVGDNTIFVDKEAFSIVTDLAESLYEDKDVALRVNVY